MTTLLDIYKGENDALKQELAAVNKQLEKATEYYMKSYVKVEQQRDKAMELLKEAKCPYECYDGMVPEQYQVGVDEYGSAITEIDFQQCLWCAERKALLQTGGK